MKTSHELYKEWREYIDELAKIHTSNILECSGIRTMALEIGYLYQRQTGRNIALHTYDN